MDTDSAWEFESNIERLVLEATGERVGCWDLGTKIVSFDKFDKRSYELWQWNVNYETGVVSRWDGCSASWVPTEDPPEDIARRAEIIRHAVLLLT